MSPSAATTFPSTVTPLNVVVMAAGKGTRMKSATPKVLHRIGGRAMLLHVLDTAASLQAQRVVAVVGHGAQSVQQAVQADGVSSAFDLQWALQSPQLGTGHAVQQALPALQHDAWVLILSGDVPLTQADTLQNLINQAKQNHCMTLLTLETPKPAGYGRIVRSPEKLGGTVQAIVEEKDATPAQRQITEIYSGIMAVPAALLQTYLPRLTNNNAQKEFYLTDIVRMAVDDGLTVQAHCITDGVQVEGVNSPAQLAALERAFQRRQADALMQQGVRLADPARFDLRGTLDCIPSSDGFVDVAIDVGCVFEGHVTLGAGVQIGAHCVIANATIGAGAVIHPFTHIDGGKEGAHIGDGSLIGPFARLRPGAFLAADVHIGNFVEVKNAKLAQGAKANHLAYVGDAQVGERVNIGAGAITANYDGANKHQTVIEADVHIGSNSVLVAPLTIGAGGTVGAGSVVTKSTDAGSLTVTRARQASIANWQRPQKLLKK